MKLQQRVARATFLVTVLACGVTAHAQTLLRTVNGPVASAQFGKAFISIPDQNGDAVEDLLVGAPGFNSGRGAIYCISGLFLATGTGAQTLWSLAPPANPNDKFGFSLAVVGDITGDGVHDFLVGQPGYDFSTGSGQSDVGAVRLVHGSTHSIVSLIRGDYYGQLGFSIAACGDLNLNGFGDVAIGAPGYGLANGAVWIVDGFKLTQSADITTLDMAAFGGANYSESVGSSVASGLDLTGDGIAEIVAGAPGRTNGGAQNAGSVVIYDAVHNQQFFCDSFVQGECLGVSVSVAHDYDGDGVADIVAGAPCSSNGTAFQVGRAVVLSGARVVAQTPPYELYAFSLGNPAPPVNHADPDPNFRFGAAVQACADLTNDGVGEIIVGAPGFITQGFGGWSFRGLVKVFSGATGTELATIVGSSTDRLGDGLGAAIGDLDGDGLREFVLGGSLSDAGGTDSGVVKCYRLFPLSPVVYCVGKLNSLGCIPGITFSGSPSANSSAPFLINASSEINQKNGLLFYGHAPASVPFQGGTKCVASPTSRTVILSSGGSTSGADCSGSFSFDFNAHTQSGLDPTLVAGAEVYAQYWSRDPASPSTTSLSNAVCFLINP